MSIEHVPNANHRSVCECSFCFYYSVCGKYADVFGSEGGAHTRRSWSLLQKLWNKFVSRLLYGLIVAAFIRIVDRKKGLFFCASSIGVLVTNFFSTVSHSMCPIHKLWSGVFHALELETWKRTGCILHCLTRMHVVRIEMPISLIRCFDYVCDGCGSRDCMCTVIPLRSEYVGKAGAHNIFNFVFFGALGF